MNFLATCPTGFAAILALELQNLGATDTQETAMGVRFTGSLETAYRACLWSRLANRILLPIAEEVVETAEELYAAVNAVDWTLHLNATSSISVSFTGRTQSINHTHFGALKVKDAVVDCMRDATGARPNVDRERPDVRIHAHIYRGRLSLSIDLSGESLHRRGYRAQTGAAPLKENLAALLLKRAGWPEKFADNQVLFDPMCGSGTLLIEAALMATDTAPGLLRSRYGFEGWKQHDAPLWSSLLSEALQRQTQGVENQKTQFFGADSDPRVLEKARENAERAGVEDLIEFKQADAETGTPPCTTAGLVITNPPYGERLGESSDLMFLYRALGDRLKSSFGGWKVAVFSGNPDLCQAIGLKADKSYRLNNGPIDSRLFLYTLYEKPALAAYDQGENSAASGAVEPVELSEAASMFANRIKKNLKALSKWRKQNDIECYRLYDADIPEYSVAVDLYADRVHVQEYAPPKSVDKIKAFERLQDVMQVLPQVLGIRKEKVVLKQRKKQSGTDQYEKQANTGHFFPVKEHGCKLRVNLHDYLDTGLFLDHRPVRRKLQQMAAGKDVLNLFCYTASASVHAAVGGAKTTTSVDMSATYLQWAMKNLAMNGFADKEHKFIQSDCMAFLKKQRQPIYDIIFMDPPTFSNSKRMQDVMDVQRDHVNLIKSAMRLLRRDGVLIFSNNYRRFKLDYELLAGFAIKDITAETLDPDFKRNPKIHCCFEIRWMPA